MIDGVGRNIDYIRISVTDRCNLRCVYCMPPEGVFCMSHEEIMTYDEIIRLCKSFAKCGIRKVKLTGGEPLVRKNIEALITGLYHVDGIEEVTMTTNGILLADKLDVLIASGIRKFNISLDTLDPTHFGELTRGGDVSKVLEGIHKAVSCPGVTVKLNCVPNSLSDKEILGLASLAKDHALYVRFIELMPVTNSAENKLLATRSEDALKALLEFQFGPLTLFEGKVGNGPSTYYELEGFKGKIGFISAMSHKFCASCNRIRLTSNGFLKTCLQYNTGVSLLQELRGGMMDDKLQALIEETIRNKPLSHHFGEERRVDDTDVSMAQIGG